MISDDLRAATADLSALVAERAPGTTLEIVLAAGSRPVLSRLRAHAGGRWTCIRRGGHVLSRGRALMDAIRPMCPHTVIWLSDVVAIAEAGGGFVCFRRALHEGWITGAGACLGTPGARAAARPRGRVTRGDAALLGPPRFRPAQRVCPRRGPRRANARDRQRSRAPRADAPAGPTGPAAARRPDARQAEQPRRPERLAVRGRGRSHLLLTPTKGSASMDRRVLHAVLEGLLVAALGLLAVGTDSAVVSAITAFDAGVWYAAGATAAGVVLLRLRRPETDKAKDPEATPAAAPAPMSREDLTRSLGEIRRMLQGSRTAYEPVVLLL